MLNKGENMNNSAFLLNLKNKMSSLFSNKKKSILICIIVAVIVIYLLFFNFNDSTQKIINENDLEKISISSYSDNVEDKLESMLLSVDEISSVSVMVMVESTPKIEYLTELENVTETNDKGSSSTSSTTVVFEKDGSVSTPVVITTFMPKVTGVFIVTNNISASTKISIINSISVVLNVDSSCISILQKG